MSTLYEIVELANGDIALQKEGDTKQAASKPGTKGAPLVTMRFSTDLLRFLRGAKMDVAKVMIEAGLERVANLAESVTREELESKLDPESRGKSITARPVVHKKADTETPLLDRRLKKRKEDEQHPTVSHLLH